MKNSKLALVALMALGLTQAAGCIFIADDGEPTKNVFHTTWSLTGPAGPVTCASKGAEKVSFLFTKTGTTQGFDELFPCEDLAGDTGHFAIATYKYVAALLDCPDTQPGCPGSTSLGQSDPLNVDLAACNLNAAGTVCSVTLPTIGFAFAQ